MYPITTPEQMSMFLIDKFEDRLREHLEQTFNVKTLIEQSKGAKSRIIIKITGEMNDIENALNDLMGLFLSLHTRKFDDKTGTKI
jgi:hypothetical protein